MHLCYVRLGFLASAYINQVGETARWLAEEPGGAAVRLLPRLARPPILSYDGYALYNWKRFDPAGPIALGNIDTIQNFVHLYDEHWFILVHVEIEAIAAGDLAGSTRPRAAMPATTGRVNKALRRLAQASASRSPCLRRIPEKMDPALYYKTFRPVYPLLRARGFRRSRRHGRWTSAAKPGRRAASCRRSSPS